MGKLFVCAWFVFIRNTFPNTRAELVNTAPPVPSTRWSVSIIWVGLRVFSSARGGFCVAILSPKAVTIPHPKIPSKNTGFCDFSYITFVRFVFNGKTLLNTALFAHFHTSSMRERAKLVFLAFSSLKRINANQSFSTPSL